MQRTIHLDHLAKVTFARAIADALHLDGEDSTSLL